MCVHTAQTGVFCTQKWKRWCRVVSSGESWGGKLTPTAETLGLWRPVGWLLGVCHSLVHWTLPLHRVLLFSWFFFLSSMTIFQISALIMTISRANISQTAVAVTVFFFSNRLIFSTSCTVFCCYCCYCRCIFFSVSQSFCSCSQFAKLRSLSLFSLFLCMFPTMIYRTAPNSPLKQCLENPVQELNFKTLQ